MKNSSSEQPAKLRLRKNKEGNIVIHEYFLNHIVLLLTLILCVIGGIWATFTFPWSIQPLQIGKIGGILFSFPLPLFILPVMVVAAMYLRSIHDIRLVLCPEYLIYVSGVISWKEKTIRVEYSDIREIEIDQTLYQKSINVGDIIILIISTQIDSALQMPGVKNPRLIKDYLRQKIKHTKKHSDQTE